MKKAALVYDKTQCPAYSGTHAHVSGAIQNGGQNKVFYQNIPVAVVSSPVVCHTPDQVVSGSAKMFIQNKAVARQDDKTAHGATLIASANKLSIS